MSELLDFYDKLRTKANNQNKQFFLECHLDNSAFLIPLDQIFTTARINKVSRIGFLSETILGIVNVLGEPTTLLNIRNTLFKDRGVENLNGYKNIIVIRDKNEEDVKFATLWDNIGNIVSLDELTNITDESFVSNIPIELNKGYFVSENALLYTMLDIEKLTDLAEIKRLRDSVSNE